MMIKSFLILCSTFFLASCNSKDTPVTSMCTMLSWENTLKMEIQLSDELTEGYKILVNDKEITSNCVESTPCLKKLDTENNVLKLTLAYPKSQTPGKIDFFLIDNTKLVVNRIEKFDAPLRWEEAGLVKDNRECGVIKKAELKLTVEGFLAN